MGGCTSKSEDADDTVYYRIHRPLTGRRGLMSATTAAPRPGGVNASSNVHAATASQMSQHTACTLWHFVRLLWYIEPGLADMIWQVVKPWTFDVIGKWRGPSCESGTMIYHLRITVIEGAGGDALWRGAAEDGPFWEDEQTPLDDAYIARESAKPAPQRGREIYRGEQPYQPSNPVPLAYTAGDLTAVPGSSQYQRVHKRPPAAGDEVHVAGLVQWYLSEETEPETLARYEGSIAHLFGVAETDLEDKFKLTGVRALEYVAGCYSPMQRRLRFAGTHISNAGLGTS